MLDRRQIKQALAWSALWIALAVFFGIGLAVVRGNEIAGEFAAAYLLEKTLSIDNVFMFFVVFAALAIPTAEQAKILRWGIGGALVMRLGFILAGAELITRWHSITYVFGAILVLLALGMLRKQSEGASPPRLLGWLKGRMRPALAALVTIELVDLMFAIDSVPAGFSVTEDWTVLFAANAFAILGLRSLYVVLVAGLKRIRYLHYGLAGILGFAGAKLLAAPWISISPLASVAIIAGTLVVTILAGRIRTSFAGELPRSASDRSPYPS